MNHAAAPVLQSLLCRSCERLWPCSRPALVCCRPTILQEQAKLYGKATTA